MTTTFQEIRKLANHLKNGMKPGLWLVSIPADYPEWQPSAIDDRELIFLYSLPPKPCNIASYLTELTK